MKRIRAEELATQNRLRLARLVGGLAVLTTVAALASTAAAIQMDNRESPVTVDLTAEQRSLLQGLCGTKTAHVSGMVRAAKEPSGLLLVRIDPAHCPGHNVALWASPQNQLVSTAR